MGSVQFTQQTKLAACDKEQILGTVRRVLRDEAEALKQLEASINDAYAEVVNLILCSPGKVIVTGMGKSGLIARKIAATMSSTGTVAVFMHPGEAMHGDLGIVSAGDIVIAIGKSGESDELNSILFVLKRIGAKIVAITGSLRSTLAAQADVVIHAAVDKEACPHDLAPTTSTTAALAIGDALAISLMEAKGFKPEDFALFHPGGRLGRRLLLKVSDLMIELTKCPVLDAKATTMADVIMALGSFGLGIVLFVDSSGNFEGILTDGDIRRLLEAHGDSVLKLAIPDVLNRDPFFVEPTVRAVEALGFMENRERPLNVLPVLEGAKPCGIVRLHELVVVA